MPPTYSELTEKLAQTRSYASCLAKSAEWAEIALQRAMNEQFAFGPNKAEHLSTFDKQAFFRNYNFRVRETEEIGKLVQQLYDLTVRISLRVEALEEEIAEKLRKDESFSES